jgi:hypothetical protein
MPAERRWAIAAAVALTTGLSGWGAWYQFAPAPERMAATVESLDGVLYRISNGEPSIVSQGAVLPGGAEIRTAKGSSAMLRLGDGSRVELKERSGFTVSATRRNLTVHLDRGSVLVEAAKRRTGHLYVASKDCRVEVTGTVFHVNSAAKGSRVSVIEGEVRVAAGRDQKVLHSGDQFSTSESMYAVPVQDEIAWSRNLQQHVALLREFSQLRKDLERIELPGLRYSSRLIGMAPKDTAIYAAIPNLGRALGEAGQIIEQRMQESPVLREWWDAGKGGRKFSEMIAEVREVSEYLGDEIVLVVSLDAKGRLGDPVFLAETRRGGLRKHLQAKFGGEKENLVPVSDNVVALTSTERARSAFGGFAGTAFHRQIEQSYRQGTGLLFSADLERLATDRESKLLGNFRHVVVEQKESGGATTTQATVTFQSARKGLASWLAAPAPMSALDYVSPNASLAAAFVIQNPAVVIDEIFALARSQDPKFDEHLAEVEVKLGVNIRNDLAGSLGSEIAVALDGAAIPPEWKVVAEVYNAGRLQWAIQKIVEASSREISSHGAVASISLSQQSASGRTYYTIAGTEGSKLMEAHYTYLDGFLIAASSRALVDQAIQNRANGFSLSRSQAFQSLLPRDTSGNYSGVLYANLGGTLGSLARTASQALDPEQRKALEALTKDMKPMLFALYGEADAIRVATNGSLVGMTLENLAGIQGPLSALKLMGKKHGPNRELKKW